MNNPALVQNQKPSSSIQVNMSSTEGRQSPPPEQQSGAQLKSVPGQGQGTDDASNKEQTNSAALDV